MEKLSSPVQPTLTLTMENTGIKFFRKNKKNAFRANSKLAHQQDIFHELSTDGFLLIRRPCNLALGESVLDKRQVN